MSDQKDDTLQDENLGEEQAADDSQDEITQLKESLARAMADVENSRKRMEREKAEFAKFANAQLLNEILPCIDNLKKASDFLPEDQKDTDWCKGLSQAISLFDEALKKQGVEEIKTVGEKLDPNLHEALMQGPGEKDMITEEFEKGYSLNGQVIRFAKVKVGDGS